LISSNSQGSIMGRIDGGCLISKMVLLKLNLFWQISKSLP